MVAQDFITSTLARNLTIAELATLADALDTRAGECFDIARVAHARHNDAVCVRFNSIGIDAQDTADALRAVVYEMARQIGTSDCIYITDEAELVAANAAHSQFEAA